MTKPMLALLHRDLRVARRELPYFLLRVGLQPLLFTFIFGFVMPRLGIIQRGYTGISAGRKRSKIDCWLLSAFPGSRSRRYWLAFCKP